MGEGAPVVSFQNFSFQYYAQKRPTLHDINLDIYAGEKVVIIGPSGSGKSTLGSCLNGLIPFSYEGTFSGTLTINGTLSTATPILDRSRVIGTVLQDTDAQFVGLNAGEDIAFSLENDNTLLEPMREAVKQVAARVGLTDHLLQSPQNLSGGQKQRAALGGVLVDKVEVLLFDEPLASLDPRTGMHAIEIIDDLCRQEQKTVLIIEHRLEEVLHRGVDRLVLMDEGRIVADQPPDELIRSDLLRAHGLREPLYVSLFRYARLDLSHAPAAQLTPLNSDQQEHIRHWFAHSTIRQPSPSEGRALELRAVGFSYENRRPVLRNISFTVFDREIIAVVGKNGAGKSTMCKLICGFEPLAEGEVYIGERNVSGDSIQERANRVGYVMQNPNHMITKQIVFEEVALGLQLRRIDPREIDRRVDEALGICGLSAQRHYPISALSYGQKKRVTIAAILVLNPQVIILDEPTAGQDYRHYSEIMEFLRAVNTRLGVTILLVTHDMHLMLEYAHRAIVLSDGEILADLPTAEVLTDVRLSEQANLKETSLYHVAQQIGVNPRQLVERFVFEERASG